MKIVFGTVVRNAPVSAGGEIVLLDWATKQIIARQPVVPIDPDLSHDPNPRGNSRGCRGIALIGDRLVAADYHTLRFYDLNLEKLGSFSDGLMAGLHEICVDSDHNVWVTSTVLDAALCYDVKQGRLVTAHWPRDNARFCEMLDLAPCAVDRNADNRALYLAHDVTREAGHLHLNAVAVWQGDVYALFHAKGVVANLTRGTIVVQNDALRRGHNLIVRPDGVAVINDTYGSALMLFNLQTGAFVERIELTRLPYVRSLALRYRARFAVRRCLNMLRITHKASVPRPIFARGLAFHDGVYYVGISPATILAIDAGTRRLTDYYSFSSNVGVCVHGLAVVP